MNVYDFDKTIYAGDCSVDFFLHSLRRHPSMVLMGPRMAWAALRYKAGAIGKTQMKEVFFSFLKKWPATPEAIEEFWDGHIAGVRPIYFEVRRPGDLVITASPEFLVAPACARLGIRPPIGSRVDPMSGCFEGKNCHGEEKVRRLRAQEPEAHVETFWSDSRSDVPLAQIAEQAFLVRSDGTLVEW